MEKTFALAFDIASSKWSTETKKFALRMIRENSSIYFPEFIGAIVQYISTGKPSAYIKEYEKDSQFHQAARLIFHCLKRLCFCENPHKILLMAGLMMQNEFHLGMLVLKLLEGSLEEAIARIEDSLSGGFIVDS